MIRNLAGALALFFRQAGKSLGRQPKLAAFVPEFPLRCQHCEKPIKLTKTTKHIGSQFSDEDGKFMCETSTFLPHRPMPSVLG